MTHLPLPSCLHDLDTRELGTGLVLAHCGYRPELLDDNAYEQAGIPAPVGLDTAVAKRRTEYLAGRLCARAALQQVLGMSTVPEIGPDRAPLWPPGAVGAITHSHGDAAVLVGDQRHWQGLGLDRERWLTPQRADRLCDELLVASERKALDALAPSQRAHRITLTFSVKESLFKTLYPLTGQRFYFHDAALEVAVDAGAEVVENRITLLKNLSAEWTAGTVLAFQVEEDEHGVLSWITVAA